MLGARLEVTHPGLTQTVPEVGISKLGVYRSNNIKYYVFLLEKTSDQAEWMDFQKEEEETWETQFVPVSEAESMLRKNKDMEYRKMLLKALSEAYHRWKMNRLRG